MFAGSKDIFYGIASVAALAILVVSCKSKLATAEVLDVSKTPVQTVDDMFAVQTKNGSVVLRVESSLMERYISDTAVYESFPKGIAIYGYADEGMLETVIVTLGQILYILLTRPPLSINRS